jgi:hypothetical protein
MLMDGAEQTPASELLAKGLTATDGAAADQQVQRGGRIGGRTFQTNFLNDFNLIWPVQSSV